MQQHNPKQTSNYGNHAIKPTADMLGSCDVPATGGERKVDISVAMYWRSEKGLHRRRIYARQALIVCLSVLLTTYVFRFFITRNSVSSVSAVQTGMGIGVYWDAGCTLSVDSIDWGVLPNGGAREIVVYVRNGGNQSFYPVMTALNWNPANAPQYLHFSWDSDKARLGAGEVARVPLRLSASFYAVGISTFGFDIDFEQRDFLLGDVNKDGVVNMRDLGIVAQAFGSAPGDPGWNPDADLNKDGLINMRDIGIVQQQFGRA